MYCFQCGEHFKTPVNYCTQCGMKMPVTSTKQHRGETRAGRRRRERKQSPGRGITIPLSAFLGGIAVLILLGVLALTSDQSPDTKTGFPAGNRDLPDNMAKAAVPNISQFSDEVVQIASQFKCLCGGCDLNLAECDCTEPDGAIEAKRFIQKLLEQGKTREEIITAFSLKYGMNPIDS